MTAKKMNPNGHLFFQKGQPFDIPIVPAMAMAINSVNRTGYVAGPPSGTAVGTFDTRANAAGPSITSPLFERIECIAVDETRQIVWVGSGSNVFPIDVAHGNKVGTAIPMPDTAQAIAICPTLNTGYVIATSFNSDSTEVVSFDLDSHRPTPLGSVSIGTDTVRFAVDEKSGTGFYILEGDSWVYVIDLKTGAPNKIDVALGNPRLLPHTLTVGYIEGKAYVFVGGEGMEIGVIDVASLSPRETILLPGTANPLASTMSVALTCDKYTPTMYVVIGLQPVSSESYVCMLNTTTLDTLYHSAQDTPRTIILPGEGLTVAVDQVSHVAFIGSGLSGNRGAITPVTPAPASL